MADTLTILRTRWSEWFFDTPTATIDQKLNDQIREICQEYPVAADELSVNLTASDFDYAITTDTCVIFRVLYYTAADEYTELALYTWEEFEAAYPAWRVQDENAPHSAFIRGDQLCLFPTPDTSTTAGYPIVKVVRTKQLTALSSGSDTLDQNIPTHEVILYGALLQHAGTRRRDLIPHLEMYYKRAKEKFDIWITGRIADKVKVIQSEYYRRPTV